MTEAHVRERSAQAVLDSAVGDTRTRDLSIASPMLYHKTTESHAYNITISAYIHSVNQLLTYFLTVELRAGQVPLGYCRR